MIYFNLLCFKVFWKIVVFFVPVGTTSIKVTFWCFLKYTVFIESPSLKTYLKLCIFPLLTGISLIVVENSRLHLTWANLIWPHMISDDLIWPHTPWPHLSSSDLIWTQLTSSDLSYPQQTSGDLCWPPLTSAVLSRPQLTSIDPKWPTWLELNSSCLKRHQLPSINLK